MYVELILYQAKEEGLQKVLALIWFRADMSQIMNMKQYQNV